MDCDEACSIARKSEDELAHTLVEYDRTAMGQVLAENVKSSRYFLVISFSLNTRI